MGFRKNMATDRQHVHQLLDRLAPGQLDMVAKLLEVMIADDADLTEDDMRAVASSREYFQAGNEGVALEQLAAQCGLTMDQIREYQAD
jgi:hypothetical protein